MNEDRQRYAIHAAVFAALANPTRHELMHLLCEEARTGSDLAVLQREGLVKRSREDGRVLWEVVDPRLSEACALIDEILGQELAQRAHILVPER
jgi:DNA-binding transcriptional ArsR family regulator